MFSQLIWKSQLTNAINAFELISMLDLLSIFLEDTIFDTEIIVKGRLLQTVSLSIKENQFSKSEGQLIMGQLFKLLGRLHSVSFDFKKISV